MYCNISYLFLLAFFAILFQIIDLLFEFFKSHIKSPKVRLPIRGVLLLQDHYVLHPLLLYGSLFLLEPSSLQAFPAYLSKRYLLKLPLFKVILFLKLFGFSCSYKKHCPTESICYTQVGFSIAY